MNGAEHLVRTLGAGGIDVCFANPGTSEMHFVDALDRVSGIRCVLGLFEGVVTGAADGYARMADRPAATLLHLGPGLANGLANLHNARRARSPVVNVIGDHASYHKQYDAPLTSDVEGTARPYSDWVRTSLNADSVAADGAAAIAAASSAPGRVASLILPADAAWSTVTGPAIPEVPVASPAGAPDPGDVAAAARALRSGRRCALVLAGRANRADSLHQAGRIASATGASLLAPTHTPRITRGAGTVEVTRLPYGVDPTRAVLAEYDHLVLVGAQPPVGFFAYPDKPSRLWAPGTVLDVLCRPDQDPALALAALVEELGAGGEVPPVARRSDEGVPTSTTLDGASIGAVLGALLPDGAVVVDESVSTGRGFMAATRGANPHDWIIATGGSIGYGMPNAIGAAIACPDRKVVTLQADGSGMYTLQALWTQARERLDVLTLVFSNRRYQILDDEMRNVGASGTGPVAESMFDLGDPDLDWVSLARGLGVEAVRVDDVPALVSAVRAGLEQRGPVLVEIML